MGILEDVMKVFDRWDEGKRMRATPGRVDELERRVSGLEERFGGKWPPDVCKYCGERAARMSFSHPNGKGKIQQDWTCSACNEVEVRVA